MKKIITVAVFATSLLVKPAAQAQTREEFEELKRQLKALQEKTEQLEKRLAIAEAKPAPKPVSVAASASAPKSDKAVVEAVESAVVNVNENGFIIKSGDDQFKLRVGGLVQADARFFVEDDNLDTRTDTFLMRRIRPIFEGKVWDDFGFRIMPDFGGGTTVLQDAYIEYTAYEVAQLRAGKFKEPVGLERLQSASDLFFVERGLPTNLVPNRDVGVQLSGSFLDKVVNYQIGVFNGAPDGGSTDLDNNDDKDVAARLWLAPFKKLSVPALKGLNAGVAGTFGQQNGPLPTYRSPGQQSFFSYSSDVVADGDHWRVAPQAYYSWGPFGLLAEYVRSEQELNNGAGITTDTGANSWQVVGTYLITGEDAAYKGVKPRTNTGAGGWGALEIVARYGELDLDEEPFNLGLASITSSARSAQAFGIGLNWYINKNVRFLLDYDHTTFDGGDILGDRPDEDVILSRLQVAF